MNNIYRIDKYDKDEQKISCWVYKESGKQPYVFEEQKPNTQRLDFYFYNMNHYFWTLIQQDCILQQQGVNEFDMIYIYNTRKLKEYILRFMYKGSNLDFEVYRNEDGMLDDESMEKIYKIHPRILKIVLQQYVYRAGFTEEQNGKIQKQCYLLFDKGQGISNPHWTVSLYCDLVAFWQKFGLNYYDIQRLPQEVFDGLRRILNADNELTASKIARNNNANKSGKNSVSYGF